MSNNLRKTVINCLYNNHWPSACLAQTVALSLHFTPGSPHFSRSLADLPPSCSYIHFHCALDRDDSYQDIGICAKLRAMLGIGTFLEFLKCRLFTLQRKLAFFTGHFYLPWIQEWFKVEHKSRKLATSVKVLRLSSWQDIEWSYS